MSLEKRSIYHTLNSIIAFSFFLYACDDPSSQTTDMPQLNGETLAEAKSLFEGVFAMQVTTTTEQELPIIGISRSQSIARKLLRVREESGQFFAEETFCQISMSSDGPAVPSVPHTLVKVIPPLNTTLLLNKEGDQWSWERPRSGIALGVQLENLLTDQLPTSEQDDRVWDQDMDGQPGVTLNVTGLIEGDIYTIIRYVDTLSGTHEEDHWVGNTLDETEQKIVGASQEVLKLNTSPMVVDDPSLNTVFVYPLDEEASCDSVISKLDQELGGVTPEMDKPSKEDTEFPPYAERSETPPERPEPREGAESIWWTAFHSGEIERVFAAIEALDRELEEEPTQYQLLFARVGANAWLLSTALQEGWATEDYIEESTRAIPLSERALEARDGDGRVLAFIGTSYVLTGEMLGNDDLVDQGWAYLELGVSEWPEVVLFTWGMNLHGRLSVNDPRYQIALDSVFESIRLCFGEVNRDHPSVEGLSLLDSEWVRRACVSNEIAPHSNEGFWLTSGDLFLKAGQVDTARILYQNAKLSPSFETWSYQSLINERIDHISDFAERWSDDDEENHPFDYGADTPCKVCHQN